MYILYRRPSTLPPPHLNPTYHELFYTPRPPVSSSFLTVNSHMSKPLPRYILRTTIMRSPQPQPKFFISSPTKISQWDNLNLALALFTIPQRHAYVWNSSNFYLAHKPSIKKRVWFDVCKTMSCYVAPQFL